MSEHSDSTQTGLTHLNEAGEANMVDVSDKTPTRRTAVASGTVAMRAETLAAIQTGSLNKGEVLAIARVAGIQGAKRCSELVPLCHPLALNKVQVDFETLDTETLKITALCRVDGKTGVEMEALTAVSIAALTIYDMCKAIDRDMVIGAICLEEKRGGKSGDWTRRG